MKKIYITGSSPISILTGLFLKNSGHNIVIFNGAQLGGAWSQTFYDRIGLLDDAVHIINYYPLIYRFVNKFCKTKNISPIYYDGTQYLGKSHYDSQVFNFKNWISGFYLLFLKFNFNTLVELFLKLFRRLFFKSIEYPLNGISNFYPSLINYAKSQGIIFISETITSYNCSHSSIDIYSQNNHYKADYLLTTQGFSLYKKDFIINYSVIIKIDMLLENDYIQVNNIYLKRICKALEHAHYSVYILEFTKLPHQSELLDVINETFFKISDVSNFDLEIISIKTFKRFTKKENIKQKSNYQRNVLELYSTGCLSLNLWKNYLYLNLHFFPLKYKI